MLFSFSTKGPDALTVLGVYLSTPCIQGLWCILCLYGFSPRSNIEEGERGDNGQRNPGGNQDDG